MVRSRHPLRPQLVSIADSDEFLLGQVVKSGALRINVSGCRDIRSFQATIGETELKKFEAICVEPLSGHYQINLVLPDTIHGTQMIYFSLDGEELPPCKIEMIKTTADNSRRGAFRGVNGQLLRSSAFKTQLATIEWLLETQKDKEAFWNAVLDHAGFAKSWQSLAFEMASNAEGSVHQLKKEFGGDGAGPLDCDYLLFGELVVNVRNDLNAFLEQLNITTFGTLADKSSSIQPKTCLLPAMPG